MTATTAGQSLFSCHRVLFINRVRNIRAHTQRLRRRDVTWRWSAPTAFAAAAEASSRRPRLAPLTLSLPINRENDHQQQKSDDIRSQFCIRKLTQWTTDPHWLEPSVINLSNIYQSFFNCEGWNMMVFLNYFPLGFTWNIWIVLTHWIRCKNTLSWHFS